MPNHNQIYNDSNCICDFLEHIICIVNIKLSCTFAKHKIDLMELNGFDHFIFFIICILLPGMSILSARATEIPGIEPVLPEKKHIYFSNGLLLWIGAMLVLTNWNLTDKSWEILGVHVSV